MNVEKASVLKMVSWSVSEFYSCISLEILRNPTKMNKFIFKRSGVYRHKITQNKVNNALYLNLCKTVGIRAQVYLYDTFN
jgi:hypothetical protein